MLFLLNTQIVYRLGSKIVPDGFNAHIIVAASQDAAAGDYNNDDDDEEDNNNVAEEVGEAQGNKQVAQQEPAAASVENLVVKQDEKAVSADKKEKDEDINEEEEEEEETAKQVDDKQQTEETDKLLEKCFLEAIKNVVTDDQLPCDSSLVYNKMLDVRPENSFIDIKKSSFKKLSKFIKEMVKKKYIKTKDVNSVLTIVSINRSHPLYKAHVFEEARAAPAAIAAEEAKKEAATIVLQIVPLNKATAHIQNLFPEHKDCLYTDDEVKQILMEYCEKQNLYTSKEQKNHVKVDQFLITALFKPSENMKSGQSVSITMVLKKLMDKMTPFYAVVQNNDQVIKYVALFVINSSMVDVVKLKV